jgi:hypothetical protein
MVLSADEKSQIQALDRTQPGLKTPALPSGRLRARLRLDLASGGASVSEFRL